jgi:hypothetical protein
MSRIVFSPLSFLCGKPARNYLTTGYSEHKAEFTPVGDVKAIFDPIDFVIFDGMNRGEKVRGDNVHGSPALSALLTWGSFIPTASASAETLLGPLLSPVMTFCWWELDARRPYV